MKHSVENYGVFRAKPGFTLECMNTNF